MILPTRGSVECEPLLGHELLGSPMFVGHPESGQRTAKWSSWNCAGAVWCCDIGLTCEMFGSTSVKKDGKISLEIHGICRYLYHDPYFPIHIIPYLHWTYPQAMTSTTEHLGENLFVRSSWPKQPIFQEEGIQHVIVIANYKEVRRDNWSFPIWKGLDVGCLWVEMTLISWTVKKHVLVLHENHRSLGVSWHVTHASVKILATKSSNLRSSHKKKTLHRFLCGLDVVAFLA